MDRAVDEGEVTEVEEEEGRAEVVQTCRMTGETVQETDTRHKMVCISDLQLFSLD